MHALALVALLLAQSPTLAPKSSARTGRLLYLPGTAGAYASTPDSAALDVTGDIDIRAYIQPDDWTPTGAQAIVSKFYSAGAQRSYLFQLAATTGTLNLWRSSDLINSTVATSTVAVGATDGTARWVRVTWRISDSRTQFFTSTDGEIWTQLGTDVSHGLVTATAASTATLGVGAKAQDDSERLAGKAYYADVRRGIGGPIMAVFDARDAAPGVSSFTATVTGETWTVNGTAAVRAQASPATRIARQFELPGTSGNYASTPDSASISITGDIDLRSRVSLDDWTPSADDAVIKKWGGSAGYALGVTLTGKLSLWVWIGGAAVFAESTVVHGITDGATRWIRATRLSGTGVAKFYTSTDGVTWTQLGADVATTAGAIVDNAVALTIIASTGGWVGARVYYAEVRSAVDGPLVAIFNPSDTTASDTSFVSSGVIGETWTINGTATLR